MLAFTWTSRGSARRNRPRTYTLLILAVAADLCVTAVWVARRSLAQRRVHAFAVSSVAFKAPSCGKTVTSCRSFNSRGVMSALLLRFETMQPAAESLAWCWRSQWLCPRPFDTGDIDPYRVASA